MGRVWRGGGMPKRSAVLSLSKGRTVLQARSLRYADKRRAALRYGLRFAPAYSGTAFLYLGSTWRTFKLALIGATPNSSSSAAGSRSSSSGVGGATVTICQYNRDTTLYVRSHT